VAGAHVDDVPGASRRYPGVDVEIVYGLKFRDAIVVRDSDGTALLAFRAVDISISETGKTLDVTRKPVNNLREKAYRTASEQLHKKFGNVDVGGWD
jgi:hypothetical protein